MDRYCDDFAPAHGFESIPPRDEAAVFVSAVWGAVAPRPRVGRASSPVSPLCRSGVRALLTCPPGSVTSRKQRVRWIQCAS